MDLDEWEFLPDHGFLDMNNEVSDKKIFSGKHESSSSKPSSVFNMNYFMCPSSPTSSHKILETSSSPRSPPPPEKFSRKIGACQQHVVPVPIQLEPRFVNKNPDDDVNQMTEKKINKGPDFGFGSNNNNNNNIEADQDAVSKVFFKKKENEFVDMKMDSPRSPTSRNLMAPQLDAAGGAFNFDDNKAEATMDPCSPRKNKISLDSDSNEKEFDLWKWSLTGIGAICSFGVAAATMCIIIFGTQQRNQHNNKKLRFQIYADDKRIKHVVQQATKMNEAISSVRGVPITRAHITIGGYYDSL
ncbi:hypothetical protein LWI29_004420 [Acer saccharum]|uniref:DUF6821 domain-containing protein n=1 Tax=Acer saccharum TaxID=4024 RepID=A0AA39SJH1_ACESA|nr:hypothetical protein LWI29_004420 [Acer saccharum]KAK1583658.1 hypothetical protein Q3G72_025911 [Acer saccharum]